MKKGNVCFFIYFVLVVYGFPLVEFVLVLCLAASHMIAPPPHAPSVASAPPGAPDHGRWYIWQTIKTFAKQSLALI